MPGTRGTAASAEAASTAGPEISSSLHAARDRALDAQRAGLAGDRGDLGHGRPAELAGQHGRDHLGRHVHRRVAGDDQVHVADVPDHLGQDRGQLGSPGVSQGLVLDDHHPVQAPAEGGLGGERRRDALTPDRHSDQLGARFVGKLAGQLDGHGVVGGQARLGPAPVHRAVGTYRCLLRVTGPLVGDHNPHHDPPDGGRAIGDWPVILTARCFSL